ncbi:MAG: type IV pilus modification PilV family protein [Thermoanaerobaculia bacterium]
MSRNDKERGMSLAEVLVALGIVAIIVTFSSSMITTALRGTQDNINKQFATQKAVSMLEELRALIQTESGGAVVLLDDYDNGTSNEMTLTTRTAVTDPADPTSGNKRVGGQWLFERRITVQRVQGANDVRLVNVKVYVRDAGGLRILAEVAGVLSTIPNRIAPTQVYDVYLVAVENVPGWWVYMQNIVPFVEGAISDLQARHPGLVFRQHWIRKLSYGRDGLYTPYLNTHNPSTDPIPSVYFYPGLMPDGSAVENYYPGDFFKGRVATDDPDHPILNGYHATDNPLPYSLADQYNNSMRYPDEWKLFDDRANTVVSISQDGKKKTMLEERDAPTLRLLLDDMVLNPNKYRNAIIINLHGELFPFPPVRNYADAAKLPDSFPNVRVVTHPERLTYANDKPLTLRVYSYHTNVIDLDAAAAVLSKPITIRLKGISWSPVSSNIQAITGGIDVDEADGHNPDWYEGPKDAPTNPPHPKSMYFSSGTDGTDTYIYLYNSPLKTPCAKDKNDCDKGGLASNRRLYGNEYIPSPVEDLPNSFAKLPFETTLAFPGTEVKNTARWVITIPAGLLPKDTPGENPVKIETWIHSDDPKKLATYPNYSSTYVWRGSDVWLYGDTDNDPHLPITERFQFLGDPRHCPYADLKKAHTGSGLSTFYTDPLGMGYNRYFDDFHGNTNERSTWPGWSYKSTKDVWFGINNNTSDTAPHNDVWRTHDNEVAKVLYAAGPEIDIPRIYQVMRAAVLGTNAVYTTMTGFSYYYVGIGNEIGYDLANGFDKSIPVSSRPFTGKDGSRFEQSIIGTMFSSGVKYVRENVDESGDYWWAMSWLGELYPDDQWKTWEKTGNLVSGEGKGKFVRVLRSSINTRLPAGTVFTDGARRTQEEGSPTFFWGGSNTSTFHHRPKDGTNADIAAEGTVIANTYKLTMPPLMANNRPFDLTVNDPGRLHAHFLQNAYGAPTTLTSVAQFYKHTSGIHGSSLVAMRDGDAAAFVVVNGLSPTGESGTAFIARWSFLSLIQSYLTAGLYSTSGVPHPARVRELPRVEITSPGPNDDLVDPEAITVEWDTIWKRWDGLPYTPSYANNFKEDSTVRYSLLYSRDNGRTWLRMKDDSEAEAGKRPAAEYLQTETSYQFNTPAAKFPKGNYVLRVEAYRDQGARELPLHYSFHQYRAFIKRSS